MKCFFHKIDLDGLCSAAIIKNQYKTKEDIEFIGINYGDSFDFNLIQKDETIFFVDFSLQPITKMKDLADKTKNLIWIDHHIGAINSAKEINLTNVKGILRNGNQAACELVYEFINGKKAKVPLAIKLLSLYDTFTKDNKNFDWDNQIIPFQYGMYCHDISLDSNIWNKVIESQDNFIISILESGRLAQRYSKNILSIEAPNNVFDLNWKNINFICANTSQRGSKYFENIFNPDKHDAMLVFNYNGICWTFSMYTEKENIDILSIAKSYGGSGHVKANGFQYYEIPFLNKLKISIKELNNGTYNL